MSARPNHGIYGYWIPNTISTCKCSECGFIIGDEDAIQEDMCPDCGCYIGEQEYSPRDAETVPVVTEQAEQTIKIGLDKLTAIADSEFEKALEKGAVKLVYEPEHDAVNHPNHYCKGGVECLDAIKAALGDKYEGFLAGNVLKYVYRYPDKNGVEDCKKARFYLDKLIQELEV